MDYQQLEETLARLPSVMAIRVAGTGDRLEEIHVLAAPEKAAKQVVRDVQTLVMARFGIEIDRRIVSVVQIGPDRISADEDRPAIIGVHEIPEGTRVTVAVTLRWHGEDYVGTATGPSASSARLRLVGESALSAAEDIIVDEALALDAIGAPTIGMRKVINVVIISTGPRGEDVAIGSSLSSGDDNEATVRAVLDALNRRISRRV
ncbi:hypothetical protein HQ535_10150 [bacterium]|nr:hypothetical protein [bacterium]